MNRFKTGNVFKLDNTIGIVYRVDSDLTHWVSFTHEQSSGCTPNVTKPCEEQCWSCDTNISDTCDTECEYCKGTGYYKSERIGMDRATFLASNVKEYIMARLTQNFEF